MKREPTPPGMTAVMFISDGNFTWYRTRQEARMACERFSTPGLTCYVADERTFKHVFEDTLQIRHARANEPHKAAHPGW